MEKISAVYQIKNVVTGERYVGSTKDVKHRWAQHKSPSRWEMCPNSKLYQDMKKYGVDKFRFQILAPVMPKHLKQVEQELIELLKPEYNSINAHGMNVEKRNTSNKKYEQSDKGKERYKKYRQSEKRKAYHNAYQKKYDKQLCLYNDETLTLGALTQRFRRAGVEHPNLEAKKYILNGSKHFMNTIR